jgi:DNA-binding response OmpR family regulator
MEEARVIVVDDSPDIAEALAYLLTSDGYSVRTAYDGAQAVVLVDKFAPHCVLFDINMPIMDGNELSKQLRERFGDDIVLVAITGEDDSDRRISEAFGRVDHYLQKPVDQKGLRRVLPRQADHGIDR